MKKVSIKHDIYIYLFGIVIVLTSIYGLMINHSYRVGLNESAKYGFLYELKIVESEYLKTGHLPQSTSSTLQVYLDLENVPEKFRSVFDWSNFINDTIYNHYTSPKGSTSGEYLYAASHKIPSTGDTLYVVSQYNEAVYLELFELSPPDSISQFNTAFILIGCLLLFVFLLIRLLIYRLTKPILQLSQWSETLDLKKADELKKIRYHEVDMLASQLIESVRNEKAAIEREEFFLRAASHELRTPVSIVSASIEMLERLSGTIPKNGQRAIARIKRSVMTMQTLVTTLLWMSRNNQTKQKATCIDLNKMIMEVVENQKYLAKSTKIKVELEILSPNFETQAPHEVIQIILNNLLRNAFQHSSDGIIYIKLFEEGFIVTNPIDFSLRDSTTEVSEVSFGIGLILIEKLCSSQGWQFTHQVKEDVFIAHVSIPLKISSD